MTDLLVSKLTASAKAGAYDNLIKLVEYAARKQVTAGWAAHWAAPTADRHGFRLIVEKKTRKGHWAMMSRVFSETELVRVDFAEKLIYWLELELNGLAARLDAMGVVAGEEGEKLDERS